MKKARNNHRHIPVEIIEEILLNLPFKPLIRFSSVTKSWNSMIFEAEFVKRYRARERDFLFLLGENPKEDSTCRLSSISWKNPSAVEANAFASPFETKHPQLRAKCDELLLAHDFHSSLFLWNPSSIERCKKKLPQPLFMSWPSRVNDFSFGLGYDSVGDDFKILKIPPAYVSNVRAELYSLRSDSWREIPNFSADIDIDRGTSGVFVSGKLHWLARINHRNITWFDLSTEKFGEMPGPDYIPPLSTEFGGMPGPDYRPPSPPPAQYYSKAVSALRGALCVYYNYHDVENEVVCRCIVWVMDIEAAESSWSKKFSIKCDVSSISEWMEPLYVYDNGEILVRVNVSGNGGGDTYRICVYKDESSRPKEVISRSCGGRICDVFIYARLQPSRMSRLLRF